MTRLALTLAALLGTGAIAAGALAASPAETIQARVANFKSMGKGMKGVIEQMKAPTPDFAAIRAGADAIAAGAPKIVGYFPKGTGPEAGVKTEALPAIWEKNAEFQKDAGDLVAASKGLQAAAASNDIAQVKTAFMKVGGACKACHDSFREKD